MKIEKIAENKIRVILSPNDFKDKTIDIKSVLTKTEESQRLFLEILSRAKNEINFDTDGYKLLIETFSSTDDIFICTITKFFDKGNNNLTINKSKLHLIAKKKSIPFENFSEIYEFSNFEEFCDFCNFINKNNTNLLKGLFKNTTLYLYNNTYYLIISNINCRHPYLKQFHSSILEFSNKRMYCRNFESKLKEHGKTIISSNAINTTIKFFCSNKTM